MKFVESFWAALWVAIKFCYSLLLPLLMQLSTTWSLHSELPELSWFPKVSREEELDGFLKRLSLPCQKQFKQMLKAGRRAWSSLVSSEGPTFPCSSLVFLCFPQLSGFCQSRQTKTPNQPTPIKNLGITSPKTPKNLQTPSNSHQPTYFLLFFLVFLLLWQGDGKVKALHHYGEDGMTKPQKSPNVEVNRSLT